MLITTATFWVVASIWDIWDGGWELLLEAAIVLAITWVYTRDIFELEDIRPALLAGVLTALVGAISIAFSGGIKYLFVLLQALVLYHLAQWLMEEDQRTAWKIAITYLLVKLVLQGFGYAPDWWIQSSVTSD
jgi:intracellular septation protein A